MESTTDDVKTASNAGSESPSSKCPICLSEIENPAYTDKCFHQFCFNCLLEWSKVNAVCPLCKQDFRTIVYDVQSYEKFKELPVKVAEETMVRIAGFSISGVINHRTRHPNEIPFGESRFRYRTTMSWPFRQMMRRLEEQRLTDLLRQPSLRVSSGREFVFSEEARKAVYRSGVRVQHLETRTEQLFSCTTPRFFQENPACKIRLSQWLQRELRALLDFNNRYDIDSITCVILNLLDISRLASRNFCTQLQPYFGHHTYHFLQELYCFARSAPYTMSGYDSIVVYGEGTNGAIWSDWHRVEARMESRISLDHENNGDGSLLPLDRPHMSFQISRRPAIQTSESGSSSNSNLSNILRRNSPIPSISRSRIARMGMSSQLSISVVDSADEDLCNDLLTVISHESDGEVEVIGEDPPWLSRSPIVVSDESECEIASLEQRSDNSATAEAEVRQKHGVSKRNRSGKDVSAAREVGETSKPRDHSVDRYQQKHSDRKKKRRHKSHSYERSTRFNPSSSEEYHERSYRSKSRTEQDYTRSRMSKSVQGKIYDDKCHKRHRMDSPSKCHADHSSGNRDRSPATSEKHKRLYRSRSRERLNRSIKSSSSERSKYLDKHKKHSSTCGNWYEKNSSDRRGTQHSTQTQKRHHEVKSIKSDSRLKDIVEFDDQVIVCSDHEQEEGNVDHHINLSSNSREAEKEEHNDLMMELEKQQNHEESRTKNSTQFWSDNETDDEVSSKTLRSVVGFSSFSVASGSSQTADSLPDEPLEPNLCGVAVKNDDVEQKIVGRNIDVRCSEKEISGKIDSKTTASEDETCEGQSIKSSLSQTNDDKTVNHEKLVPLSEQEEDNLSIDCQAEVVNAIFCNSVYASNPTTFKKHSSGHKNSAFKLGNVDQICRVIENYSKNS